MLPRFALQADLQTLLQWSGIHKAALGKAHFADHNKGRRFHPVLRINAAGERELAWMREGLIPSYACDDHDAEQRTEAHAEAMTCDSCFRSAFRRRRCVVPATILHEQRHLSDHVEQPCSFALESDALFGIAAVWETWINDQGHAVESFAIVTVLVAPMLRSIFERMPVILETQKDQEQWLHRTDPEHPPLDLLQPLTATQLSHWKMMPGPIDLHLPPADPIPQHAQAQV